MSEKIKISTHSPFQKLKAVVIGQVLSEDIFDWITEECVLVSSYNKEVFDFLKKHKVEPIIVPLRHRYFWDGGLHCCSLDLVHEGVREDYIS